MRFWPWKARPPETRESYGNIVASALFDHAVGSIGAPQPSETSAVVACSRLWSAAASTFAVTPDDGPLTAVLPEIGWRLAQHGAYAARLDGGQLSTLTNSADCRPAGTRSRGPTATGRCARWCHRTPFC